MEAEGGCPVVARVRQTATAAPRRTAVVAAGRRIGYEQLWSRVERWASRCVALGLPARSLVCIVADGDAELPAAFLGVRAAGLVPMLVDARLPAARVAATVAAARPAAVIQPGDGDEVAATAEADPRTLPEGTGYVVFSSGSQGVPKGIVGQARGLIHFVDWEIERLGAQPGARTAMLTSPSFDVVLRDLLLPLCSGGELHIAEGGVRASPRAVLPWLAEHGIEILHVVPSLSARWLAAGGDIEVGSLRWTLFAGEPLYEQQVTRWRSVAPRSRVLNLYGPAETTLAKFCYEVPPSPRPGLQPVGRPLPGTLVDLAPIVPDADPSAADALEGLEGVDGARRIAIVTEHGSLGYLEGTAADDVRRLRRTDGATRFLTQDRGHWDVDGNLVVMGRLDSLVKRNGAFVDLARIESAAADLPEVRAACCLQLAPSGQIVLAVEGPDAAGAVLLRKRLQPQLGSELPDRVVALPTMPLLPGGKVDRRSVSAELAAPDEGRAPAPAQHGANR